MKAFSLKLKLLKHPAPFFTSVWLRFQFSQFPSLKFSDLLRESDMKKLLKSKQVGVFKVVVSFLAFLCFFG